MSFISEYESINVEINKSKGGVLVDYELLKRDVSFIRIGNTNYPSYPKVSQQYNSGHLPPVTNTCHISCMFLQSITIDVLDSTCWNDYINSNRLNISDDRISKVTDVSISTTSLIGNLPVLSFKHLLFESFSIYIFLVKKILFV